MKYLGMEIEKIHCRNKTYWKYEKMTSNKLREVKQYIRKLVLPTYQPTKTLVWLEEQTGLEWVYSNEYNMLSVKGEEAGEVYDFKDNTAFLWLDGSVIINPYNEDGTWEKMTPREFIEKISKGEWD